MKKSRISIEIDNQLIIFDQADILYIITKHDESIMYLKNGKKRILNTSLKILNELINNPFFFRIHPSFIISLGEIEVLVRKEDRWFIVMSNQMEFRISSSKLELFKEKFIIL